MSLDRPQSIPDISNSTATVPLALDVAMGWLTQMLPSSELPDARCSTVLGKSNRRRGLVSPASSLFEVVETAFASA